MKQIKTIKSRRDFELDFDDEVNEALRDGWTLLRRYIDPGFARGSRVFYPVFVAELEREVPDEGV
ncbi:MAG: hypothetical protein ACI4P4_15500 [Faecousia sp.]